MQSPVALAKYTTASALFLALFVGNSFLWRSPVLGGLLLLFLLLYFGRTILGAAAIIAGLSIVGSVAYYVDVLDRTTVAIAIVLVPLVVWIVRASPLSHLPKPLLGEEGIPSRALRLFKHRWRGALLALPFALLFAAAIALLLANPITTPVRSPWLVIPAAFFLLVFFLAWLTVAKPKPLTVAVLFFLAIAVALFAYPLGYGFDAFIHRATEQHIFDFGTITPKPLYYVGQYALVLTASHGFALPVNLADLWLVPLLAALLIPLIVYDGFQKMFGDRRGAVAALAIFLIPLGSLIVTTPQGLANVWSLAVIGASLPLLSSKPLFGPRWWLIALFAAAALVTHPLAGIPVAFYVALIPLFKSTLSKWLKAIAVAIGSIMLPIIFLAQSAVSHLAVSFNPASLFQKPLTDLLQLSLFVANRFHPFLDAAYLWGWNRIVILIVVVIGAVLIMKNRHWPQTLRLPMIMSGILLINYLLLATVVGFDFLISYEQSNYSDRVFEMMQFFLLPAIGLTLVWIDTHLEKRPPLLRFGWSIVLAIVVTASVYLAYPRHDNYEISRGFNVGMSDFDTAQFIHDTAGQNAYVVLANQAVSAAAMQSFGFAKYYKGDIFYYPIPTGGPLYQIYLDMVDNGPSRAKALQAMDLAGVDTAYFVVNDYWWMADKIIENAKRSANSNTVIDNGATTVFVYTR